MVLGFERSSYAVFEGEEIEVCIKIVDRELTNDEARDFIVATNELDKNAAEGK